METDSTEPPQSPPTADAITSSPSSSSSSSSPSYNARVSRTCVYPPTIIRIRDPDSSSSPSSLFQFSLHTAPLTITRELHTILPTLDPSHQLLILPTFQHSNTPLTDFTPQTEAEKNRLLESFSGFARALCLYLISRGYFADYIDPCTGHPALTRSGGAVYSEVDGASALLRYRVEQAGFCSIILHPLWGSGCYPASCVTNARVDAVLEGLERVRRRWEVREDQNGQGGQERTQRLTEMVNHVQQSSAESEGVSNSSGGSVSSGNSGGGREEQQLLQDLEAMYVQCGKMVEEEEKEEMSKDEETPRIITVSTMVVDDCW